MANPIAAENNPVVNYARFIVRWRYPVVLLSLVITMALGNGGKFLGFDTGYRVFFSEDNPQLQAFDALENIYNKNDNVMMALAPKDGNVFDPEFLTLVAELTEEAWRLPFARRVDSLTNFQHTRAEEDDLIVEDLVLDPGATTPEQLAGARQIALDDPLLFNRVIPADTRVTGINITFELPGEDPKEGSAVVSEMRAWRERIEAEHPDVQVYLTGVVMLNNAFSEGGRNDMTKLTPIMFGIMIVAMIILLRSASGVVGTLLVIAFSTMAALGIAGYLGMKFTPPSSVTPTMIMTLAVADSIHILISMLGAMRDGLRKDDAIVESIRVNLQPVFLTSLTTAIGFLSLNLSDAPPFRDLGNMAAMGVTAAFVYSVTFLPAFMSILPVRVPKASNQGNLGMDRLADFVISRRRPVLWISSAAVLGLMAFIPRNDPNDKFVDYFDQSVSFRVDSDFVMENLTGLYQVEYSLGSTGSGGISEPAYLRSMDEFATYMRAQPGVKQVSTLSHTMKKLNKNMHGDDPSMFTLPDNRELAAQYLLLYEMSLPMGLDLNNQINVDKSSTRVSVVLENMTAREMRAITQTGEQWLRDNAPAEMFSHGIGPTIMFAYISERNIRSMILGTLVALVFISLSLMIAMRSARYGFISLLPNLIPAAMAFGLWGILVSRVDLGLSTVSAISLGIVVDDTVHFLSKYLRAKREHGLDAPEAVRYAFNRVGKALVVTSLILVSGFLVMTRSTFALNSNMGWFTAIAIVFALVADFFLLPALLMFLDRGETEPKLSPQAQEALAEAGA